MKTKTFFAQFDDIGAFHKTFSSCIPLNLAQTRLANSKSRMKLCSHLSTVALSILRAVSGHDLCGLLSFMLSHEPDFISAMEIVQSSKVGRQEKKLISLTQSCISAISILSASKEQQVEQNAKENEVEEKEEKRRKIE